MDTCMRGFSFMPSDTNINVKDLQYIEGTELERTWKTSRRERLKEQEQKIWDEFVKEEDLIRSCNSDPYQFLHQLPESCIKEMLETELEKMKSEKAASIEKEAQEQLCQGEGDTILDQVQHTVTFADDLENEDSEVFHIFDDEGSGPEDEALMDSAANSPSTVREKESTENLTQPPPLVESPDSNCNKSIENVANEIESNIYWAKVKEIRLKINEEILNAISLLDCLEVFSLERDKLARVRQRANQFAVTYQRNRLYPLHRQITDIKRMLSRTVPFGRHTQFLALMVRVVSLHQNILVAFQVLSRSFEQTYWLTETSTCVRALLQSVRDTHFEHDIMSSVEYNDQMLESCDKLDEALNDYTKRVVNFFDAESLSPSKAKHTGKKKLSGKSKSTLNTADTNLSMYSIDTNRLHNTKSCSSRDMYSAGTSKVRIPVIDVAASKKGKKAESTPKSGKKSRRPLMRAPSGRRRVMEPKEQEVTTMVEAVENCASSFISRTCSPTGSMVLRSGRTPRTSRTPRSPRTPHSARKLQPPYGLQKITRSRIQSYSPKSRKLQSIINAKIDAAASLKKSPRIVTNDNVTDEIVTVENDKELDKHLEDVQKIPKPNDNVSNENVKVDKINDTDVKQAVKVANDVNVKQSNMKCDKVNEKDGAKFEKEKNKNSPRVDVTRLLKQLCNVDGTGTKSERISGSKNVQLHCITGGSPRQPSTPQLLKILEETIQKKVPRSMFPKPVTKDLVDRYRLTFNIAESTADKLYQYRTKFVQHMLTSPLYANSAVGKPWEMIGSVCEQIIDDILLKCVQDMQLDDVIYELYRCETN